MLCLFIDAWNREYLRYMPFLRSLQKECLHGDLEVPLGYTSIIASFVTGMWPDKHGVFDLFSLDKKPHHKIKNPYLLASIRLLQNKRMFYTPLQDKRSMYFKPTIEKTWPQKNCLPCKTIFDILEENKKSFEVIDWPNHFKNRFGSILFSKSCSKTLEMTKKAKADFIFSHFLDLEVAHKFGIHSKETINAAKEIDNAAKELYDKDKNILFFSDHGMNDIEKEVNISEEIESLNLKFGKDLIYLIGSTTVEFWFKNEESKKKVANLLSSLRYGKIIDKESFRISADSDIIFLANFKTAFCPNSFSKKQFKAMHGWNPLEQKTLYILKNESKKGVKNAKMIDFFPTISNLMNIQKTSCDGNSLV